MVSVLECKGASLPLCDRVRSGATKVLWRKLSPPWQPMSTAWDYGILCTYLGMEASTLYTPATTTFLALATQRNPCPVDWQCWGFCSWRMSRIMLLSTGSQVYADIYVGRCASKAQHLASISMSFQILVFISTYLLGSPGY